MLPVKKDGKIILRCQKCGYEMPAPESVIKEYTAVRRTPEKERVITTKVVAKAEKPEVSKEDIEQAKEEYYELVLDQIGEYGE